MRPWEKDLTRSTEPLPTTHTSNFARAGENDINVCKQISLLSILLCICNIYLLKQSKNITYSMIAKFYYIYTCRIQGTFVIYVLMTNDQIAYFWLYHRWPKLDIWVALCWPLHNSSDLHICKDLYGERNKPEKKNEKLPLNYNKNRLPEFQHHFICVLCNFLTDLERFSVV